MSVAQHFEQCNRYMGRPVKITTRNGRVHRGIVRRVNRSHVFLEPIERQKGLGGFGYPFWGGYPGYGYGAGWGIALGTILGISLLPLFFW